MAADGYFLCCMGANFRDAMADLYRPFWASSIIAVLDGFDNSASDMFDTCFVSKFGLENETKHTKKA